MTTENTFVRIPGTGYLFHRAVHPDVKTKAEAKLSEAAQPKVAVWDGHLTFPGQRSVRVDGLAITRTGKWHFKLREFPKTDDGSDPEGWKLLATFEMPLLGDQNYSEGTISLEGRSYKVRLYKTGRGYLKFGLPQVMKNQTIEAHSPM